MCRSAASTEVRNFNECVDQLRQQRCITFLNVSVASSEVRNSQTYFVKHFGWFILFSCHMYDLFCLAAICTIYFVWLPHARFILFGFHMYDLFCLAATCTISSLQWKKIHQSEKVVGLTVKRGKTSKSYATYGKLMPTTSCCRTQCQPLDCIG